MNAQRESHLERERELHKRLVANYEIRYRDAFSQVFQKEWNRALLAMNHTKAERVLDLGCGTGVLLADLTQKYRFVVGSDVSREMMQVARKLGTPLIESDGSALPFRGGFFDLVICRGVLHHVRDRQAMLAEIHRVLRQGGELILSEPSNDWWLVRTMRSLMYRFSDKFDEEDEGFLSDQLRELIEATGFREIRMERFGYSAYVLAGFPDQLPVLRYLPGNVAVARLLIKLDRLWARAPLFSRMGLQVLASGRRLA